MIEDPACTYMVTRGCSGSCTHIKRAVRRFAKAELSFNFQDIRTRKKKVRLNSVGVANDLKRPVIPLFTHVG